MTRAPTKPTGGLGRVRRAAPSRARALIAQLSPRRVRVRFAMLFGALFIASGAMLLGITYVLVDQPVSVVTAVHLAPEGELESTSLPAINDILNDELTKQAALLHEAQMQNLLVQSGIALTIMAAISVVLSWLLARRVLRPMRTLTAGIHRISASNVHERLAVGGPRDEISELASSVDGLLARLEAALESHKRFVANAAHELRTPLTIERSLLEESLLDRDATVESFRENFERLRRVSIQQGTLLESLLTLAVSERGVEQPELVDLADVTESVVAGRRSRAGGVQLTVRADSALVAGDPALLERLVANLIDNAIYYNIRDGRVDVAVETLDCRAVLTVSNTGRVVPEDRVDQLFEPFQRLHRTADDDRHGLGLSIVRAIAVAHDAALTARAHPDGGLLVEVSLPVTVPEDATVV